MLITSRVQASVAFDESMRHRADPDEVEAMLREQLTAAIVREGEAIGAFIRPQSVSFDLIEPTVETPWVATLRAMWDPEPTAGCEFRGGPADGAVIALQRVNGVAPRWWRLPTMAEPTCPDAGAPINIREALYRRAGVDSERDRWVYTFDSVR